MGRKGPVPEEDYTIPLGVADIKRSGRRRDGRRAGLAGARGARRRRRAGARKESRSRSSIRARWCRWTRTTIRESVRKTGRLVIADEAGPTAGFSAEVAAVATEDAATFARLKAPVKRVCALQVPIPYSPVLENAVFPDRNRIIAGIREVLEGQQVCRGGVRTAAEALAESYPRPLIDRGANRPSARGNQRVDDRTLTSSPFFVIPYVKFRVEFRDPTFPVTTSFRAAGVVPKLAVRGPISRLAGRSVFWRDEHVAHAAHRPDRLGVGGVGLDLATQPGDAQVDRTIERLGLAMGGDLQQPVAHQRPVRVLGEDLQQVELACRQALFAVVGRIDQIGAARGRARVGRCARAGPSACVAAARRNTLLTRASSSRGSNGLAM